MKKPPPLLTPRIIADLRVGEECGDPDHPGLRVRRTNAARAFFYRYRARDGALREIKLGEFGPMTLAGARKALGRLKLERERGIDPQVQKQQSRADARRQHPTVAGLTWAGRRMRQSGSIRVSRWQVMILFAVRCPGGWAGGACR